MNGYDAYSLFLTAPAMGMFGLHLETIRGAAAVMGVLAIEIVYLPGVQLLHRQFVAVLAASYIALDPWAVHTLVAGPCAGAAGDIGRWRASSTSRTFPRGSSKCFHINRHATNFTHHLLA